MGSGNFEQSTLLKRKLAQQGDLVVHFYGNIQDPSDAALVGAYFAVYTDSGYSNLASLYSDNNFTPTSNTVTSNSLGEIEFYIAGGRYYFSVSRTGYTTQFYPDFDIVPAIGVVVPFTSPNPGPLTVAHRVGYTLPVGVIQIQAPLLGEEVFQSPTAYDANNIYLHASAINLGGTVWVH